MSKLFNYLTTILFVSVTLVALAVVTDAGTGLWVSSAYGSSQGFEQTLGFSAFDPTDGLNSEADTPKADAEVNNPYPYPVPIPVRMERTGNEVSLLAQILDLLLTMSLSTNDVDKGIEVYIYQLNDLNAYDKARTIGSAFKTEIFDKDGRPVSKLDEPISMVFSYDDTGMTEADEEALKLYKWDEIAQKWLAVESSVDIVNNTITAYIHVDVNAGGVASGQSLAQANSTSLELALMGRSRLYLPLVEGPSAQAAE